MPTISINLKDFAQLLGRPRVTPEQLATWLPLVKGEVKEQEGDGGEIRVELQDSNRPDLWSTEGIARQIQTKLSGTAPAYPFFKSTLKPKRSVTVSRSEEHTSELQSRFGIS